MKYAPIIIPTLFRYEKLKQCIESLRRNSWADKTEVYIGLDYPLKEEHKSGYNKIYKYLQDNEFKEFKSVNIYIRKKNIGSFANNKLLREEVCKKYDRYIRTDDDIVFSPNFLEYMDKCLDKYESDPQVVAVCGYSYPIKWKVSEQATVFRQNVACHAWGIGYWRDKEETSEMLNYLRNSGLRKDFDKDVKNCKLLKMIDARFIEYIYSGTMREKTLIDSVSDVSIATYIFLNNKSIILPVLSKAKNLGFDGSGEYCQKIIPKKNSQAAGEYDYKNQEIDESRDFELVEDSNDNYDLNNRLINQFDKRNFLMKLKAILLWVICLFLGSEYCSRLRARAAELQKRKSGFG